jgi:hypothetical protein
MKPIKVSHLSIGLAGLGLIAMLVLGALMWTDLEQFSKRIRANEQASASQEVKDGLARMEHSLRTVADTLGRWEIGRAHV